jgi:molybdate transport system substrate-binding protein
MLRLALTLCLSLAVPKPALAETVTVFAAASLGSVLEEIAPGFEAETGHDLAISAAGSSALARQIALGAPADVVISASAEWMDWLEAEGHIAPESRIDLATNRLALVGHGAAAPLALTPEALRAQLGEGHLAMALVEAVPAGIYGKAALQSLGLWEAVADRVAQADNVRAALALVAAGAAPLGIVYATDARAEPRVSLLALFPEDSHPPIRYPAARVVGAGAAAQAFLDHLRGEGAQAVLRAHGFGVPGA